MLDVIQVITTVDSEEDAQNIAGAVVGERLAACAQVIGPISSTYHWSGDITNAEEWMVILKSRIDPTTCRNCSPSPSLPRAAVISIGSTASLNGGARWGNSPYSHPELIQ